ncbi:putative E3 ubiquitin-protein ligase CCNB1IP1 [Rosellinia necatrix]|uniref:Putative E3 ubiquitin-protein ligase CCNB1IP1 n=1 Tax=Rosellinia necatrix TaxID=77044 RepID=A0A1S8A4U3_ROSNE|nr:putative E3 ubiquitin-protein ligase CCNB1IP1 [Rosellinia necatrix]
MEHTLQCNVLKCRKELGDRALVTTCYIFQQHMSKTLTEKYSSLNVHLDKVVNEANAEIANCHNKLKDAEIDRDELRKKYEELLRTCKEKNKKLLQTQELYDKLKRKAMLGQVQDAAEDAVESTLQAQPVNSNGVESQEPPYFQSRDALYGQSTSSLHDMQRSLGPYGNSQANIPTHIGSWPRTFGAQSEQDERE